MPYDGGESMTNDFANSIIQSNSNCHVVAAGNYNVNFSCNSVHTAMLCSYCDNAGLLLVVKHNNANIDFAYHFGMQLSQYSIIFFYLVRYLLICYLLILLPLYVILTTHQITNPFCLLYTSPSPRDS